MFESIRKVFNRYFFFGLIIGIIGSFFTIKHYYSNLYWTQTADTKLAAKCYRTLAIRFLQNWLPINPESAETEVDLLADRLFTVNHVKTNIEK